MASMTMHQETVIEEEDRISALADELICHILSLVPTVCAMTTSLLSKRWKNMWTSVPILDFDNKRDMPFRHYTSMSFVNRVLLFRGLSDIQKFQLKLSDYGFDFSPINDWICTAGRCNVVELDLRLCGVGSYDSSLTLRPSFFWCKTLKVLKLSFEARCVIFNPPASTSGCFPSLKSIHVTVTNPYKGSIKNLEKLFSYCPALEDLTIQFFIGKWYLECCGSEFKVCATQLKTLTIEMDEHDYYYYLEAREDDLYADKCLGPVNIYVNAPKLGHLYLKNVVFEEKPGISVSWIGTPNANGFRFPTLQVL